MNDSKSASQSKQTCQPVIPELVSDLSGDLRFASVIEIFLAEFSVLLKKLMAAAARNDLSAIQKTAHKLKGAAASAGFARLFDLACQMEDHSIQGRLEDIMPLLDHLNRIGQSAAATPSVQS